MYNFSMFHYADEIQVRTYYKPVSKKEDNILECDESDSETKTGECKRLNLSENNNNKKEDEKDVDRERSLQSSYNRTKQSVYGIARANKWDYFITLTLDPRKIDRSDLDLISEKFNDFMYHLKKRKCPNLKYLFVPELHSDGINFHLHGLISNWYGCEFIDSGKRDAKGRVIYNWENWKWGFSTATRIDDSVRASAYITKYITKELCSVGFGKKRFWRSTNCISAQDVREDYNLPTEDIDKFLETLYSEGKIKYQKSVEVPACGQMVNYYEVRL